MIQTMLISFSQLFSFSLSQANVIKAQENFEWEKIMEIENNALLKNKIWVMTKLLTRKQTIG